MSKTTIIVPKPKKPSVYRSFIFIALTFVYIWAFQGTARGNKGNGGRNYKSNYDRDIESRLVVCIFARW